MFQFYEISHLRRDGISFGSRITWKVWKNLSQTEDWVNLARFLRPNEKVVLIDIGANVGDFTSEFVSIYKDSTSVCFEPVSTTFKQLVMRFGKGDRVGMRHCAVSNFDGNAEIHIEKGCTLCSLAEYTENANEAYRAGTAQ